MRKELYNIICDHLRTAVPAIRHIDLWNQNVEFIEQESAWPRPAVFVEFGPIAWKSIGGHEDCDLYRGQGTVSLHIVTDWTGSSDADSTTRENCLSAYSLSEAIQSALLEYTDGEHYHALKLFQTVTSHNHEDLLECIDTYSVVATRRVPIEPVSDIEDEPSAT